MPELPPELAARALAPPLNTDIAGPAARFFGNAASDALGINDAIRALKGQMTPDEAQYFALSNLPGLLPFGKGLSSSALAALHLIPQMAREGMPLASKLFTIVNDAGKELGPLQVSVKDPKNLWVDWVGGYGRGEGPNSIGPSEMKSLIDALKGEFPEAERIGGYRASGARQESGAAGSGKTSAVFVPLKPGLKSLAGEEARNLHLYGNIEGTYTGTPDWMLTRGQ